MAARAARPGTAGGGVPRRGLTLRLTRQVDAFQRPQTERIPFSRQGASFFSEPMGSTTTRAAFFPTVGGELEVHCEVAAGLVSALLDATIEG